MIDAESVASSYSLNQAIGNRFAATILDVGVFLVLFVGSVVWTPKNSDTAATLLMVGVPLYYVLLEGAWGATLGKLALKLRVVDRSGNVPGFGRAIVRTLLRAIEVNPFLLGALPAVVVVALSRGRRRLGDMAAGTYVLLAADVERVRGAARITDAT